MKPSNLYIPNPQKWVHFFNKVVDGKVKMLQTGGGQTSRILPLGTYTPAETNKNQQIVVKTVSPAEQTVQQAKSELQRENIKLDRIVRMNQNKRRHRRRNNGKITKISRKSQIGGRKTTGGRRKQTARKKQIGGRKKQIGGRRKQTGGRKHKKYITKTKRDIFNF